jgi:transcriptional regulator GlxA family with amidase domain
MEDTTYGRPDAEPNQGVMDLSVTHDNPPGARGVLHTRPRLNSLTRSWPEADGGRQRDQERETFSRVREYVAAHLDSRLDVDALARIVGMSVSQFSRSFHKAVGLPPHTYVIQCRVTRAQELLATTQLPLIEIALIIGFCDQAHFSRRFHELTGVPPGVFRRLTGRNPP